MLRKFRDWRLRNAKERYEFRREMRLAKHGKETPPLSFSKVFIASFSIVCLVLVVFIMFATIYLMDGSILIALAGPMVSATVGLVGYLHKATKENTEGGIQMERLKQEFEMMNHDNNAVG